MYKNYSQWAIGRFKEWETLPEPTAEWSEKAKSVRSAYLLLASNIVFLTQTAPDCTVEEFTANNRDLAMNISDILALLKESADWAVSAIEDQSDLFALQPCEAESLQQVWEMRWECENSTLQVAYLRLVRKIKRHCKLNMRFRFALIRLEWSFSLSDRLLTILKNGDTMTYLKSLK